MTLLRIARRACLAAMAVATAGLGLTAFDGTAQAVSRRTESACKADYHNFCPGYSIDSPALRHCMKSAGKNLSLGCRRALVADGEIPAKYGR